MNPHRQDLGSSGHQKRGAAASFRLLSAIGIVSDTDFSVAQLAHSDLNDAWLLPELVVRIARTRGSSNLRYECGIAQLVPSGLGYPDLVEFGQVDGYDWLATRRMIGVPLVSAWAALSGEAAIQALNDFVSRLEILHSVTAVPGYLRRLPAQYVFDPQQAASILGALATRGWISPTDVIGLQRLHAAMLKRLHEYQAPTLVHGDAHLGNALWADGALSAVLDLEGAGMAPPDLDFHKLYIQIREMATHNRAQPHSVPWLADRWSRMHRSPGAIDRLAGYSVARCLWAADMTLTRRLDPALVPQVKDDLSAIIEHGGWTY